LPSDRERLIEIISEGAVFRPDEVSCAIELIDGALARADGNTYEALVAIEDGAGGERPIGYTCYGATPMTEGTFDLYWIVVAAEARGGGIGRALLAQAEEELASRGARIVRIETSSLEGQGGASRFYRKVGYAEVGRIADFYRAGDDLVTFAKVLAPSSR
jgi:ribosomal protein S18 acetylase RimI-like enzyme